MSILGNRVLRKEDPKFLTVGGTYVDDLRDERLNGAAHLTFVRSTMAHARITGESGTIGSTPALQSAVVDAVSQLGVRHVDMPATPQRVWAAIQAAR
jgi:carbon-monoxide dehydrogenase large subunit